VFISLSNITEAEEALVEDLHFRSRVGNPYC